MEEKFKSKMEGRQDEEEAREDLREAGEDKTVNNVRQKVKGCERWEAFISYCQAIGQCKLPYIVCLLFLLSVDC